MRIKISRLKNQKNLMIRRKISRLKNQKNPRIKRKKNLTKDLKSCPQGEIKTKTLLILIPLRK